MSISTDINAMIEMLTGHIVYTKERVTDTTCEEEKPKR